jgi:hypothetical protein
MIYKKSWKYILVKDNSILCMMKYPNLYRPKALKDFKDVKKGDLGGFIMNYYNLRQEGDSWIYDIR